MADSRYLGMPKTTTNPVDSLLAPGRKPVHSGLLWIYLNGRCNFTCKYCLDDRNKLIGRAADHPDFVEKLGRLQSELGYCLVFTGGEPLIEIALLLKLFTTFAQVPKTV